MSNEKQREPELGAVATVVCAICHKRTSHYRRYQGSDYCPSCYETFTCPNPEAAAPAQSVPPKCKHGYSPTFCGLCIDERAVNASPILTQPSAAPSNSDRLVELQRFAAAFPTPQQAIKALITGIIEMESERASSPAVAPADTPVCGQCKARLKYFGNEIEPCVNCCEAVTGRTQGEDESWMTLAAFELVKHADNGKAIGSWQFILNTLKAAKLAEQRKSDRLELPPKIRVEPVYYVANFDGSHSVADPQPSLQLQEWYQFNARRNARIIRRMRESAKEATSDDLIEALKTIADAPTHITYEGIFVSTNVKDVARKALRAERDEASPEAPAAPPAGKGL